MICWKVLSVGSLIILCPAFQMSPLHTCIVLNQMFKRSHRKFSRALSLYSSLLYDTRPWNSSYLSLPKPSTQRNHRALLGFSLRHGIPGSASWQKGYAILGLTSFASLLLRISVMCCVVQIHLYSKRASYVSSNFPKPEAHCYLVVTHCCVCNVQTFYTWISCSILKRKMLFGDRTSERAFYSSFRLPLERLYTVFWQICVPDP